MMRISRVLREPHRVIKGYQIVRRRQIPDAGSNVFVLLGESNPRCAGCLPAGGEGTSAAFRDLAIGAPRFPETFSACLKLPERGIEGLAHVRLDGHGETR